MVLLGTLAGVRRGGPGPRATETPGRGDRALRQAHPPTQLPPRPQVAPRRLHGPRHPGLAFPNWTLEPGSRAHTHLTRGLDRSLVLGAGVRPSVGG